MCLAVLALQLHERWPLVIATNRDEYHDRATAPLHWWPEQPPSVLAGKDLAAGGTWMGVTPEGRLALLTNVRDPSRQRADAPSRGALVSRWLQTQTTAQEAQHQGAALGCNPFNLLLADQGGQRWWCTNEHAQLERLDPGLHGLSNARLNTEWPKVQRLKSAATRALGSATELDNLIHALFAALADRTPAHDSELPSTGVGSAVERFLSPVFIAGLGLARPYGTRCSTVLVVQQEPQGAVLHMHEKRFDASGSLGDSTQQSIADWPWPASR
jgi:uncharacterized protein with NRDE domain